MACWKKSAITSRVDGALFEIDEFFGDNAGLVVAEIELAAPDAPFPQPSWLGREVSASGRVTTTST